MSAAASTSSSSVSSSSSSSSSSTHTPTPWRRSISEVDKVNKTLSQIFHNCFPTDFNVEIRQPHLASGNSSAIEFMNMDRQYYERMSAQFPETACYRELIANWIEGGVGIAKQLVESWGKQVRVYYYSVQLIEDDVESFAFLAIAKADDEPDMTTCVRVAGSPGSAVFQTIDGILPRPSFQAIRHEMGAAQHCLLGSIVHRPRATIPSGELVAVQRARQYGHSQKGMIQPKSRHHGQFAITNFGVSLNRDVLRLGRSDKSQSTNFGEGLKMSLLGISLRSFVYILSDMQVWQLGLVEPDMGLGYLMSENEAKSREMVYTVVIDGQVPTHASLTRLIFSKFISLGNIGAFKTTTVSPSAPGEDLLLLDEAQRGNIYLNGTFIQSDPANSAYGYNFCEANPKRRAGLGRDRNSVSESFVCSRALALWERLLLECGGGVANYSPLSDMWRRFFAMTERPSVPKDIHNVLDAQQAPTASIPTIVVGSEQYFIHKYDSQKLARGISPYTALVQNQIQEDTCRRVLQKEPVHLSALLYNLVTRSGNIPTSDVDLRNLVRDFDRLTRTPIHEWSVGTPTQLTTVRQIIQFLQQGHLRTVTTDSVVIVNLPQELPKGGNDVRWSEEHNAFLVSSRCLEPEYVHEQDGTECRPGCACAVSYILDLICETFPEKPNRRLMFRNIHEMFLMVRPEAVAEVEADIDVPAAVVEEQEQEDEERSSSSSSQQQSVFSTDEDSENENDNSGDSSPQVAGDEPSEVQEVVHSQNGQVAVEEEEEEEDVVEEIDTLSQTRRSLTRCKRKLNQILDLFSTRDLQNAIRVKRHV